MRKHLGRMLLAMAFFASGYLLSVPNGGGRFLCCTPQTCYFVSDVTCVNGEVYDQVLCPDPECSGGGAGCVDGLGCWPWLV